MRCAVVLVDQPIDDHVRRQLDRLERSGARLYRTHGRYRTYAAAPLILLRHSRPAAGAPALLPDGRRVHAAGVPRLRRGRAGAGAAGGRRRTARAVAHRRGARVRRHGGGPCGRPAAGRPAHEGRGDRRERQDATGRVRRCEAGELARCGCCVGAGHPCRPRGSRQPTSTWRPPGSGTATAIALPRRSARARAARARGA